MATSAIFLVAILALGFLITFQIAKASEYVSVLKGEKKAFEQNNRVNAFLMVVFLVLGLVGVWWCNKLLYHKTLLPVPAASEHGEKIDIMLWITLAITGIVFFITQILLFVFAYKYQYKEGKKAFYYPHNNKLEVLWTTVPAVTLCILVGFGLYYWFQITGEAPKDSLEVEVTGKQFGWIFRYKGKDNTFGKKYFKNINDENNNPLGLLWDDPAAKDDIVVQQTMVIPVGQPVKLIIGSRDVIHDVGLSAFRLKMDAVPGTPTTMWFTPKYTTDEMKKMRNNPDYEYEISCDQMCGNSHYSMKGIIKVLSKADYIVWKASQKSAYSSVFPEAEQPAVKPAADSASAKKTAVATAMPSTKS